MSGCPKWSQLGILDGLFLRPYDCSFLKRDLNQIMSAIARESCRDALMQEEM